MGFGVLSPEDRADFVHPLHISVDGHLLDQLGRLRQEGGTAEVVDLEHGRTGLSSGGLEFRRLDIGETLRLNEGSRGGVMPRTRK